MRKLLSSLALVSILYISPALADSTTVVLTDDNEFFTSNAWAGVEYPGLSFFMEGKWNSLTVESFHPVITFHFATTQCNGLKLLYQYGTMLVSKDIVSTGICMDSYTLIPTDHFISLLTDTEYVNLHVRDLDWNTPDQLVVLDEVTVYLIEDEISCPTCH